MQRSTRRLLVPALLVGAILTGCSGQTYEPGFGYILETYYENGIPAAQQSALADGVLTEAEVERATLAADACVGAVPGVASVEPFGWVEQDGEFSGGKIEFEDDADEDLAAAEARGCYFQHVALIEFAWLDQFYFGEWTEENLRG
jgi:hypothetical protein